MRLFVQADDLHLSYGPNNLIEWNSAYSGTPVIRHQPCVVRARFSPRSLSDAALADGGGSVRLESGLSRGGITRQFVLSPTCPPGFSAWLTDRGATVAEIAEQVAMVDAFLRRHGQFADEAAAEYLTAIASRGPRDQVERTRRALRRFALFRYPRPQRGKC